MKATVKRFARLFAGLAFLAGAVAFSTLLWLTRPVAERKAFEESVPVVETVPVQYGPVAFDLPSQGVVEARRRSNLAAEVAGRVDEVNPDFQVGSRLAAGTWLVRLDPTDREADRAAAASALAEAESALASEEARAEQARSDWARLRQGGKAPALTVREPQLKSARARVVSAAAALARAEADLRRCTVTAPFDCVVAAKQTDLGSFLSPGAPVASVFAAGPYEVRLPIPVDRLRFLDLKDGKGEPGGVEILVSAGGETTRLPARIVRIEGEIDRASRSAYLVAEIGGADGGAVPVQPGLFVRAAVRGRTLPNLAQVPFPAFVDLERVAVVAPDDTPQFRDVTVVYREADRVYVSDGVAEGERLCLTELPSMISGLKVSPRPAAGAESGNAAPAAGAESTEVSPANTLAVP